MVGEVNGVDDTEAINAALGSITAGGTLFFPPGTYVYKRGIGSLIADTIVSDDILICGPGAIISGFNAAGATPNNSGNQYYNVFQATGRSRIKIRDLAFQGYTTPIVLFGCDDVLIEGISDEALLANAGGYLRDKSVFLYQCSDCRVVHNKFQDFQFGVYLSGDGTTQSENVTVSNNHFRHPVAAGSYTSLFPVGIYVHYANNVVLNGNTFKDIYSSLDNGSTGTGMGYGIYEGDGSCAELTISGNTFHYVAKGSKRAIGVYVNESRSATVSTNTLLAESGAQVLCGIQVDIKTTDAIRTICGNTIKLLDTSLSADGILCNNGTAHSSVGRFTINSNTVDGGAYGVRVNQLGGSVFNIEDNTLSAQLSANIRLLGTTAVPIVYPKISGNSVSKSQHTGIQLGGYVIGAQIIGNRVLDGNLAAGAAETDYGIQFTSYSFGSFIVGNVIGNTPGGGGAFVGGVVNAANAADRIFKDIVANNSLIGFAGSTFVRFPTVAPVNGIFDIGYGDFVANNGQQTAEEEGWYCVFLSSPSLSADASSASAQLTVSSTSGMLAGDIVLLTKDANPYDADYQDVTKWHSDTIASVDDGTHFTLTTGIPAGDGTYVAGTAAIRVARFKSTAAIS